MANELRIILIVLGTSSCGILLGLDWFAAVVSSGLGVVFAIAARADDLEF